MTAGQIALLLGLFAVPAALLYAGHHLRRKARWVHFVFWGSLAGHTTLAVIALWYSMVPAAEWGPGDTVRGFAGFYGMLAGGIVGALVAWILFFRDRARD